MSIKRLAALLLLAAIAQTHLCADDYFPKPAVQASISGPNALFASPQSVSVMPASTSPTPKTAKVTKPTPAKPTEAVLPVSHLSRVGDPLRARPAAMPTQTSASAAALPLPTGYTMVGDQPLPASSSCGASACGSRGSCLSRLRAWLCYRPTAGDALPKLRPHPYVGPVIAFSCDGAGCGGGYGVGGSANGCGVAAGIGGRVGPVASGACGTRGGCKTGCVPPADDAIGGYKFASVPNPAVAGVPSLGASYATYATYKPTQTVAPVVTQTAGSALARPYTKP